MSYSWFLKTFVIINIWFTQKWQEHFKTNALVALKPLFKMEKLKMMKPCRWRAQCLMAKQRKYSFRWSCPAKPWTSHLLILWSKSGHINHLMFQRFYSLWYFASLETSLLPLWFAGAEAWQISGSVFGDGELWEVLKLGSYLGVLFDDGDFERWSSLENIWQCFLVMENFERF